MVLGQVAPGSPITLKDVKADKDFHIVTSDGLKVTAQQATKIPIDSGSIAVTGKSGATITLPDGTLFSVPPNSRMAFEQVARARELSPPGARSQQTANPMADVCQPSRTKAATEFTDARVEIDKSTGQWVKKTDTIRVEDSSGNQMKLAAPDSTIGGLFNNAKLIEAARYVINWQKGTNRENGFLINPKLKDGYQFLPPFDAEEDSLPIPRNLEPGTTHIVHVHPYGSTPSFNDLKISRERMKPGIILYGDECVFFDPMSIRKIRDKDGQIKFQTQGHMKVVVVRSELVKELRTSEEIEKAQKEIEETLDKE